MSAVSSYKRRLAVTGGAGFIGSNFLNYMVSKYPEYLFVNIDCLTYAGNLSNLKEIEAYDNYVFEKIDITDYGSLAVCFDKYEIDGVTHLAAESHVDRSIIGPAAFIDTNIRGTFNLLELAREKGESIRFHQISTDEVFGSLGPDGYFVEASRYAPGSPYAATKAAADHLVRAYHNTYQLNTVISNCSNNFGPFQFPEKLLPLTVYRALKGEAIPVYGDGGNIRDWLYVGDHCRALDLIFHRAEPGTTYNIGTRNEITNIDMVRKVCSILTELTGEKYEHLVTMVGDRPGHDRRYAIDPSLLEKDLKWQAVHDFDEALRETIRWYYENQNWLENCITGDYRRYYDDIYRPKMRK
jgi:dTDP-glucose 4,6-dehydratase